MPQVGEFLRNSRRSLRDRPTFGPLLPAPMSPSPETRNSLLGRLTDRADQAAWHEFAQIYMPVVYRLALRKGLQHADAEDLAQQVLAAVSKAIDRWETDPGRAKFRTWLHRIAQ